MDVLNLNWIIWNHLITYEKQFWAKMVSQSVIIFLNYKKITKIVLFLRLNIQFRPNLNLKYLLKICVHVIIFRLFI